MADFSSKAHTRSCDMWLVFVEASEFESPSTTMSKLLADSNGVIKLTTTFPLSKLQQVPDWNAPAVARAPHSAGVKSAASSTRLASDRTVDRDEPCFITNVAAYTTSPLDQRHQGKG